MIKVMINQITIAIPPSIINKEKDCKAGAQEKNAPRLVGDIINEMFRSNSPLAKSYRKHIARKEIRAEKGDIENG